MGFLFFGQGGGTSREIWKMFNKIFQYTYPRIVQGRKHNLAQWCCSNIYVQAGVQKISAELLCQIKDQYYYYIIEHCLKEYTIVKNKKLCVYVSMCIKKNKIIAFNNDHKTILRNYFHFMQILNNYSAFSGIFVIFIE